MRNAKVINGVSVAAAWLLIGAVVLAVLVDVVVYIGKLPAATVSEHVWNIAKEYPIIPLFVGIAIGHLFWPIVQRK